MARSDGLDDGDRSIVRAILAPYAGRISRVDIFGSRATGRWRENSDLDLVVRGDLHEADIDRLWTLFAESSLSISVDVMAYDETMYPPLRRHIDECSKLLFNASDLVTIDPVAVRP